MTGADYTPKVGDRCPCGVGSEHYYDARDIAKMGAPCPLCGEDRVPWSRGRLRCLSCGWEDDDADA